MAKTIINPLGATPGGLSASSHAESGVLRDAVVDPVAHEIGPDTPQTQADVAQGGNLPVAEANTAHAELQYSIIEMRDERNAVQAELAAKTAELDALRAEHEALKADRVSAKAGAFDPTRPHIVVDRFQFADVSGSVAYEANTRIEDPFVLRRLHHLGAKLAPIPQ